MLRSSAVTKGNIYVDFGRQNSSLISGNGQVINDAVQVKQFVTLIDGLNYMASLGWEVVHLTPFETDTDGGTYDTYRHKSKIDQHLKPVNPDACKPQRPYPLPHHRPLPAKPPPQVDAGRFDEMPVLTLFTSTRALIPA
jgi:hypothetical protein